MSIPFITNVDRQEQILRALEERGRVSLADLTALFQISEATARRDLDALAEQGKVQRVHGRAILLRKSAPEPPILRQQEGQAKERVAKTRATLFYRRPPNHGRMSRASPPRALFLRREPVNAS